MSMSPAALREVFHLQCEASDLLALRNLTGEQRKRADLIMAKISSIRQTGLSGDEVRQQVANEMAREIGVRPTKFSTSSNEQRAHESLFKKFLQGENVEREARATTFVGGTQSITYTEGPQGGFLVPTSFYEQAAEGMAATDPLLDPSVVTVIQEPDYQLRPLSLPGWDLSEVAAVKVGENVQEGAANIPTLSTKLLNKFGYRIAFDASLEWDEDEEAYGDPLAAMGRATGIALARGTGQDLVNGDGSSAPQGIVTGAADSGVTTANTGKVVLGDFTNVFFSVNKIYRESAKCGWLVNDAVAKQIANAVDDQHRPLFPVVDGVTRILGKPVYTCPSLPQYNASLGTQAAGSFCVFGDLSHYYVHASSILMRRLLQVPGLIEYGKCRYHALQLVDAVLHDPTDGALAPIVSARLKA